jgi:F-type H+-transporting ATPase subunit b
MAVETTPAPTHPVDPAAEHSATAAEQHATTTAEHATGGLPQFEIQHWGGQIAYLLILFVALYILMANVFVPRMRRVFDERTRVINDALSSARAVQTEAAAQAASAQQALAEARAASQKTASDAKAKAAAESAAREAVLEEELAAKQAQAETRIAKARDAAMSQLTVVATDTAQAMVEKLTGAKVSRDQVAAAVANPQG